MEAVQRNVVAAKRNGWVQLLALMLAALMLFTACKSAAQRVQEQLDLGQKYLEELNYTEAILAYTEAIEIDPESIPAYMGRAQAYRGTEQYEEAKTDYTTVIGKTAEQPYTQAEAYIGRAEVGELTSDNENALEDYGAAAEALERVDLEKIVDVTQQMLEALKIKVYNAYARLNGFFGRQEEAAAAYTKAIESLDKLPEDAEVLDVPAEKVRSYSGRAAANFELEEYEAVLPDYDELVELGEDKAEERDTLLAALSLAKSEAGDLEASNSWLQEVQHADYAQNIQMEQMLSFLSEVAALAQEKGTDAYDEIWEVMNAEETRQAMQNLLARGYQLRYCDQENDRMLAVYAGESAWADVAEEKDGRITAGQLEEPMAEPTEEELTAVTLSPLYVYYGEYQGRSREGEGLWYILEPGSRDYEARSYQWKKDAPVEGFEKQPVQPATEPVAAVPQTPVSQAPEVDYVRITNIQFDKNAYLSQSLTNYTVTVEYDCPPNETFQLQVGHYYGPSSYSVATENQITVSGSGTFEARISVYMDILADPKKLQGTNFGFTASLANVNSIRTEGTRTTYTVADEDSLYINAAGELTRNKTGS